VAETVSKNRLSRLLAVGGRASSGVNALLGTVGKKAGRRVLGSVPGARAVAGVKAGNTLSCVVQAVGSFDDDLLRRQDNAGFGTLGEILAQLSRNVGHRSNAGETAEAETGSNIGGSIVSGVTRETRVVFLTVAVATLSVKSAVRILDDGPTEVSARSGRRGSDSQVAASFPVVAATAGAVSLAPGVRRGVVNALLVRNASHLSVTTVHKVGDVVVVDKGLTTEGH